MACTTRLAATFTALALTATLSAQRTTVSIDTLMATPFPTDLVAAPSGGAFAWVSSNSGVHNILIADPVPGSGPFADRSDRKWRAVTTYTGDEGLWITDLNFTSDARTIVFVRGDGANRQGESPNPAQLQDGTEQAVFAVPAAGGAPKRLGAGNGPVPAPRGSRVAWLSRGQIWSVDLASPEPATRLVNARGSASGLAWSPDGTMLAFSSGRGTHSYIGVFTLATRQLRYLDPSLDRDTNPVWSPDGTRLAWIRQFAAPRPRMFSPRREVDEPWSLRVADVKTGEARQIWKADAGYGSAFQGVVSDSQLYWAAGDRLVFPWEKDGWLHLYSVPAAGGKATLLTPGNFEVEYVNIAPDRERMIYSSNQDDIDRRHVWTVAVDGASKPLRQVAKSSGSEWQPVFTSDGLIAALHADALMPPHAMLIWPQDGHAHSLLENMLPAGFDPGALVTPQAVTITATDGMPIPTQLFLPKGLTPGERRPAVIFFHGGSRRQMLTTWHYNYYYRNAYAMNQWLASQGYIVLSVNYRSGIGYGLEFREALNYGASGGAEFNDVMGAGLYLKSRADVDPARIGLWGGSYGGYLTAMGLARASDLFAAGVDIHGVHDWNQGIRTFIPEYNVLDDPDFSRRAFAASPMASIDTWKSPVLLIHGDDDRNVSFIESINLVTALRKRKVDVEQLVFPDEVHDFLRHQHWIRAYKTAADFFNRRLGGPRGSAGTVPR
ncbi:MAG TPA: prolyl oligopeptidase family serine peptidase [Vicinamibacterales bacterium]|nr:prolyl oligopeptidase family serine peptidase [Vicinamibacterales bacterium]